MQKRRYKPRQPQQRYRINGQITAQSFRLLDEKGAQIGLVTRDEGIKLSTEQELDLVEIAPMASPPVVKLIDYSKFLYQQKKKKQEEKKNTHTSETKQVQGGPFIDDHDLEIKLKKAREFLMNGDKVRFVIRFKGREITRKELGQAVTNKAIEKLSDIAKVDRETHMEGRQMVTMLSRGSKKDDKKEVSAESKPEIISTEIKTN